MQNVVLFPHVGMKVPLNYAMLDSLAQEGRGRVDAEPEPERAVWESAVTKHVKAKASDALRKLCARPHVTLPELESETGKLQGNSIQKLPQIGGNSLHASSIHHQLHQVRHSREES